MPPSRILIVYGTNYGQTAKIARHIRDLLVADGCEVEIADAGDCPPDPDVSSFTGVMIGGSLIRHRHQRAVALFVARHHRDLQWRPTAFFSVSGSAGSTEPQGQADARAAMDAFLAAAHWNPSMRTTIGGAMAFTKYSPILRWIMKRISRASGGPTDTSRDYELTDWNQVDEFTRRFAAAVAGATRPHTAGV